MSQSQKTSLEILLSEQGIEIYQTNNGLIQIAERVRLHMMDSGVRVVEGAPPSVRFIAKAQRSDFPNEDPAALFSLVETLIGKDAAAKGFSEVDRQVTEMRNPMDEADVLDVWYELVFQAETTESELADTVRWALALDRQVQPS